MGQALHSGDMVFLPNLPNHLHLQLGRHSGAVYQSVSPGLAVIKHLQKTWTSKYRRPCSELFCNVVPSPAIFYV